MSALTCRERTLPDVPCHVGDPDLWFAESPVDLERAKALCADCPIRRECLAAALERAEPWGCGAARSSTAARSWRASVRVDGPRKNPAESPAAGVAGEAAWRSRR